MENARKEMETDMTEEFRTKLINNMAQISYVQNMNISVEKMDDGIVVSRIPFGKSVTNNRGSVHGGALFTLADTTCGMACRTFGKDVTTIDGSINYLLPAMDTEYVQCEANLVRKGGRIIVYRADIKNDKGDMLAVGTFTFMVLPIDM